MQGLHRVSYLAFVLDNYATKAWVYAIKNTVRTVRMNGFNTYETILVLARSSDLARVLTEGLPVLARSHDTPFFKLSHEWNSLF